MVNRGEEKVRVHMNVVPHSTVNHSSLFINVTKPEAMLFGTAPRLSAVNFFSITINNNVNKRVFTSLISV